MRKLLFPLHYAKGKKLFQIVVHINDDPGALESILQILGTRVNLIGTTSFSLGDGTATFFAFAESLKQTETASGLKKALAGSKSTLEAEVGEGKDGLLVDNFTLGPRVGKHDYVLMMNEGLGGVFDHIVKIFGTGGEVLLYEEGVAMAQRMTQHFTEMLGKEILQSNIDYLSQILTAEGWGSIEAKEGPRELEFTTTIDDCFECSSGSSIRKHCDFVRGYFEGAGTATFGVQIRAEEVECTLRGDEACVFRIGPKKAP